MSELNNKINELRTLKKSYSDLADKVLPTSALLTELENGKQEMVDAIKLKGGNSNADKSLSEIASDVLAISNIDKTFNEVDFFMAQYGLSMSPLQLIVKHFDPQYTTYVCYVVDADTTINIARGAYMMYTADGAIADPEGEYTIPEWENRFGYFVFAYKSPAVTWENFNAYFIGMYGATTTLDNRTLTCFRGIECDACEITLGASCFASRTMHFINFHSSSVKVSGGNYFNAANINHINLPQITSAGDLFRNATNIYIASLDNATSIGQYFMNNAKIRKLHIPLLKTAGRQGLYMNSSIIELYLPELTSVTGEEPLTYLRALKKVYAPKLKTIDAFYFLYACNTVEDITFGEVSNSFTMAEWSPSNITTDEAKAAKIDKTIREGIANRVQDRTDMSALTITFSQAVRNILTTETEALFAAKNWNIAPAKSV